MFPWPGAQSCIPRNKASVASQHTQSRMSGERFRFRISKCKQLDEGSRQEPKSRMGSWANLGKGTWPGCPKHNCQNFSLCFRLWRKGCRGENIPKNSCLSSDNLLSGKSFLLKRKQPTVFNAKFPCLRSCLRNTVSKWNEAGWISWSLIKCIR